MNINPIKKRFYNQGTPAFQTQQFQQMAFELMTFMLMNVIRANDGRTNDVAPGTLTYNAWACSRVFIYKFYREEYSYN